ncbi:MAG: sigma 54-interacting transcriptional regulator [Planctomycetes bacterium]|nr:sigma 54-interacting transcriptional regulator [Planctomycetota bacterium]
MTTLFTDEGQGLLKNTEFSPGVLSSIKAYDFLDGNDYEGPNRRRSNINSVHHYFLRRLDEEIKRAKRHGRRLSVLVMHVRGLHALRDRDGDGRAAEVIASVQRVIQATLRDIDLAARFGDVKFKALLPETDHDGAAAIVERIHRELAQALDDALGVYLEIDIVSFLSDADEVRPVVRHGPPSGRFAAQRAEEACGEGGGEGGDLHPIESTDPYRYGNLIGRSEAMKEVFRLVDRVAGTEHPVIIYGESGTGKELIAKVLHQLGSRAERPFIAENCAALSETLLEAELFGFVRGAFTGADRDKQGLFELADGGTLFLDEVGDMSLAMQKKLLRVLQEGEVRPLGAKQTRKVDVRVIAASNLDLRTLVEEGKFREDLFYRLNVITVKLPALRRRPEDIQLLVGHFLDKVAQNTRRPRKRITREAMRLLARYGWPGNVRELENEVKKLVTLSDDVIGVDVVSPHIRNERAPEPLAGTVDEGDDALSLKDRVERIEKRLIEETLKKTGWNKSRTSEILGLSWNGLSKKIKRYGVVQPEAERAAG